MNLVDKFLETVKDQFGSPIDFSGIENDGFDGCLMVIDNCADVHISERSFEIYNSDLTDEENDLLFAFVKYVQAKMKDQRFTNEDYKQTLNRL